MCIHCCTPINCTLCVTSEDHRGFDSFVLSGGSEYGHNLRWVWVGASWPTLTCTVIFACTPGEVNGLSCANIPGQALPDPGWDCLTISPFIRLGFRIDLTCILVKPPPSPSRWGWGGWGFSWGMHFIGALCKRQWRWQRSSSQRSIYHLYVRKQAFRSEPLVEELLGKKDKKRLARSGTGGHSKIGRTRRVCPWELDSDLNPSTTKPC